MNKSFSSSPSILVLECVLLCAIKFLFAAVLVKVLLVVLLLLIFTQLVFLLVRKKYALSSSIVLVTQFKNSTPYY